MSHFCRMADGASGDSGAGASRPPESERAMYQFSFEFYPNAYTDTARDKTIVACSYDDAERELLRAFPWAVIIDVFI